jgi:hypothetical protein
MAAQLVLSCAAASFLAQAEATPVHIRSAAASCGRLLLLLYACAGLSLVLRRVSYDIRLSAASNSFVCCVCRCFVYACAGLSLVLLWYGLYFGILGRDLAEVSSEQMVSWRVGVSVTLDFVRQQGRSRGVCQ